MAGVSSCNDVDTVNICQKEVLPTVGMGACKVALRRKLQFHLGIGISWIRSEIGKKVK